MSERKQNQQVADHICDVQEWQGRRFQRGEHVALLNGAVVAVSSDLDGALSALRALEPDPSRGMLFEVSPPVMDVIR
jgi:hypothetical protein